MDKTKIYSWEQREDEPDNAYRAFKVGWRDQKSDDPNRDRTLLEAARRYTGRIELSKVPENVSRWKEEYDWVSRAREWDRYLQRREDEALAEGREDVVRERAITISELESRQIELGFLMANVLLEKLNDPDFVERMLPKDLTAGMRAVNETISVTKL
jgi:hypothetical protein